MDLSGSVPDIAGPGLRVLFCGINPGAVSGEQGQHFARPGNRFWKVIFGAGFTDRLLLPSEQWDLLKFDLGITNLVGRVTKAASDLSVAELRDGAGALSAKVAEWKPAWVAVVGIQAYRTAFHRSSAVMGRQSETISESGLWVLPNPSGLQAHYQLPEMIDMYAELWEAAGKPAV